MRLGSEHALSTPFKTMIHPFARTKLVSPRMKTRMVVNFFLMKEDHSHKRKRHIKNFNFYPSKKKKAHKNYKLYVDMDVMALHRTNYSKSFPKDGKHASKRK